MKVKNPRSQLLKKGVVYEVPCMDCSRSYIGETGRTLQKRLMEHKAAVRRGDTNNGIAVHAWDHQHRVDWESRNLDIGRGEYLRLLRSWRTCWEHKPWLGIEFYLDSISDMTCIIKAFIIPSSSCNILSTYLSMSPHVTIYSRVSVLIVITAD